MIREQRKLDHIRYALELGDGNRRTGLEDIRFMHNCLTPVNPEDVDLTWFTPDQTILISAGASAPETVVQKVLAKLQNSFHAEIEYREVCRETLQFRLPVI